MSVFDHIDLRIGDAATCSFYDEFLGALGFKRLPHPMAIVYLHFGSGRPFAAVSFHVDAAHAANDACIAFAAASPGEVDRITAVAVAAGAREVEGPMACPEYTADYYASFFRDPEGNRLEVVHR